MLLLYSPTSGDET